MKAELCTMTHDEVYNRMQAKGREAFRAWRADQITREHYELLHHAAIREYLDWCVARAKGLLGEGA